MAIQCKSHKHINDILTKEKAKLQAYISEFLLDIGFRSNLTGFVYLRESILLCMSDSLLSRTVTDIYHEVAEKFEVPSAKVERSIRYIIRTTWTSGMNTDNPLFIYTPMNDIYTPTNTEFIATAAEALLIELRKNNFIFRSFRRK